MLSDSIREMRERFRSGIPDDVSGFALALKAFELEAQNMESRLEFLTGQPHMPLGGRLIDGPVIEIAGKVVSP